MIHRDEKEISVAFSRNQPSGNPARRRRPRERDAQEDDRYSPTLESGNGRRGNRLFRFAFEIRLFDQPAQIAEVTRERTEIRTVVGEIFGNILDDVAIDHRYRGCRDLFRSPPRGRPSGGSAAALPRRYGGD